MGETTSDAPAPAPAARQRSDPWKLAFVTLLVVGVLGVVAWLLLGSRLLVVRDIAVTGTDRLDHAEVEAAVAVPTGTPLVRVDTDAVVADVEGLRLVESARVRRGWPATLRVEVVERAPVVAVRAGDGYRLVDADGVTIADSDDLPAGFPVVSVRGEVEDSPGVAAAATITGDLGPDIAELLTEIDATAEDAIVLHLDSGSTVAWGDASRSRRKADALEILLREHPPADGWDYDVSASDVVVARS